MSHKFKSGVWEGYYTAKGKKRTIAFTIEFRRGGTIEGVGEDEENGQFTLSGTYKDQAPYPVELNWTFLTDGEVKQFTGWRESDKGGVIGSWKSASGSGSFAFAPSRDSEAARKHQETTRKNNLNQLSSMGFPEWLATEALKENQTLETAINWCTEQITGSKKMFESSSSEVDEEALTQLMSMGFEGEKAHQALIQTGGNVEQAVNLLFEQ